MPRERSARPSAPVKMKVVWAVRDMGGRTVATFDYAEKELAEARAAQLKASGKGAHFVRAEKVAMA